MIINPYNIPNDNRDAEIHLKGMKEALLALFGEIESDCIEVECSVTGKIHSAVDDINKLLGIDDEH